jgi:hypothetical protein
MDSNRPLKLNRSNKSVGKPKPLSQLVQQPQEQQREVEQPEQPEEPVVHLESLAEPPREESVYGSGWSITELMTELGGG